MSMCTRMCIPYIRAKEQGTVFHVSTEGPACSLLRVFSDARSHLGQGTGGSSKQAVFRRTDAMRFHSRHLDGAAYVCAHHIEVGFRKDGSLRCIPLALLSAWEARSLTQRHKEGKATRRTTCLDERGIRDKRELPLGVPRARNRRREGEIDRSGHR